MCDSLPGAPAGHTPAPRLTSPLLPTGGPKARGGGRGGGAARPAPPASQDAGGAHRGPQGTGRPAPRLGAAVRPRVWPAGKVCTGAAPRPSPTFAAGRRSPARPPPARQPGIPCGGMWLLAGPGGTQLAGGREGRGARRTQAAGVGGRPPRGQPRVHARTVARSPQPPPQRGRRHPPRPPQPLPSATCTAPGASAALCSTSRPGRWLPSHPRRMGVQRAEV